MKETQHRAQQASLSCPTSTQSQPLCTDAHALLCNAGTCRWHHHMLNLLSPLLCCKPRIDPEQTECGSPHQKEALGAGRVRVMLQRGGPEVGIHHVAGLHGTHIKVLISCRQTTAERAWPCLLSCRVPSCTGDPEADGNARSISHLCHGH